MKKLLTLVLCWLIAFSAMAETTFKAKTALSAAGGYITSQNKIDGSFEDGISLWSASVGTIVKTASTEMQGNNIGVWAGTGTGTLDLQWTATASNTYDANAFVNVGGEDDVYVCAYVGTTETGCKLIPALDKIQKVSVIADSIISSAFYLRLKHTGSDAFSVKVDDGKIEPWNLANVQTVEQESVSYTNYSSGTNPVVFKTKDALRSNNSQIISVSTVGSAGTASRYTILKTCNGVAEASLWGGATSGYYYIEHYSQAGNLLKSSSSYTGSGGSVNTTLPGLFNTGDYFQVYLSAGSIGDDVKTNFNITCSAIRDNVVQSYSEDRIGETLYSINPTAPSGYIPAMGQSIGKTSGTYQGEAYLALYKVAWNYATTTAGEPYVISSAKGASAQADFDAGKTITIDKRGLFVRTVGGNSWAVGAQQSDAFQGHAHNILSGSGGINQPPGTNTVGGIAGWQTNGGYVNGTTLGYQYVDKPIAGTDGLGTPRLSFETRPINTAEYAYVRYAQSMPTLLALPTRSELFSANISASGTVSNATQNFVTSCTNATPSVCSLWSSFGVTPICWSHTLDITKRAEVTATTATTATVARTDTATAFNLFCHLK